MTLEENKKICLGLIEEYSPGNKFLTDDEDIRNRLNLVYAPNYQDLSQKKKILKSKVYEIKEYGLGMCESRLPADLYQFKRLIGLNESNERKSVCYDIVGKKIFLKSDVGRYVLEYYAYPTVINDSTESDFELELDLDAQMILPYVVANDVLKVDPSADYMSFYNEYRRRVDELDGRMVLPSIEVVESDGV